MRNIGLPLNSSSNNALRRKSVFTNSGISVSRTITYIPVALKKPVVLTTLPVALPLIVAIALALVASPTVSIAQSTDNNTSTSHLDLSSNECLKKLSATDIVIASIAFKDGLNSTDQFKELVKRKPWGVGTPKTAEEINTQLKTQSPFLIITLTKEQALTLDDHRDIIRWVLVQSPVKTCE